MAGRSSPVGDFRVTIRSWHGVGSWTWDGNDLCPVCHNSLDDCHAEAKFPGDDSAVVWGTCEHAFHLACIQKCLEGVEDPRCPVCRQNWEYVVEQRAPA